MGSTPTATTTCHDTTQDSYELKSVSVTIANQTFQLNLLTQNLNGPCPLISLANVLILRREIRLRPDLETISYHYLVDLLGDLLLRKRPHPPAANASSDTAHTDDIIANFTQNLQDVIDILPSLQHGLDVNVKFDSPYSFELTPALLVFDLFDVKLVHGWTVDPLHADTYKHLVQECGMLCEAFLNSTASQLTVHGLNLLAESLPPESPCVLFRNNHFHTILNRAGRLYTLVTDQGFSRTDAVVWESLTNIQGDSQFYDAHFRKFVPPDRMPALPSHMHAPQASLGMDDLRDYAELQDSRHPDHMHGHDADLALALAMQQQQEDELRQRGYPAPQQMQPPVVNHSRPLKQHKNKCILM
ncbi:hypothetical protein SeMB42_g01744 [Synchytrium endobioticum]|uniref:MINDY deubiquitinase domain-containing protein n=1 Tax=Synchytrium endobioticum TaxID=286115 RepID=A0A507DL93_9FUNG|nr:hypothetical protein SeMB42_g01744 [Synchytrium endobioticum]